MLDPRGRKAHKELLDQRAHRVVKAFKVSQGLRAHKVHLGQRVQHLRSLDQRVCKELKAYRVYKASKALRGLRAYKAALDLLAQQVFKGKALR